MFVVGQVVDGRVAPEVVARCESLIRASSQHLAEQLKQRFSKIVAKYTAEIQDNVASFVHGVD